MRAKNPLGILILNHMAKNMPQPEIKGKYLRGQFSTSLSDRLCDHQFGEEFANAPNTLKKVHYPLISKKGHLNLKMKSTVLSIKFPDISKTRKWILKSTEIFEPSHSVNKFPMHESQEFKILKYMKEKWGRLKNIMRVFGVWRTKDRNRIAMVLDDTGMDVFTYLTRFPPKSKSKKDYSQNARKLIVGCLLAIQNHHALNVVIRDLKYGNLTFS